LLPKASTPEDVSALLNRASLRVEIMQVIDLPAPILLKKYIKFDGGGKRSFGLFVCTQCQSEFEGRMERLNVMTGLCRACADIRAGRRRAKYSKDETKSRLHVTWANMKRRCLNPVGKEKTIYAGVKLCEAWMEYSAFRDWALTNGYTDALTIDRKDSSGDYEPSNCRFVGYETQSANRKVTSKNKSGYVGVVFERGAWVSFIGWKRNRKYLGRFSDIHLALDARNKYIRENNLPHPIQDRKS